MTSSSSDTEGRARRFARAREVFESACDLHGARREAWIVASCRGAPEIEAEVRRLLHLDATQGIGLEPPQPGEFLRALECEGLADRPGERVGDWRLVERVGSGGMGTVWLVERADGEYQQRAALKLIARGVHDDELVRRFRAERQLLAELDHPGVTRLVDGGVTDDGRPFLVMPYVDGTPLDRWCKERGLARAQRIDLFERVCDAVEYAHRRGIVHGDLKPQNVLVDAEGAPTVLDFGIAQLRAMSRADGGVPGGKPAGSPDHASPEQLRGEPLTPASDVYSLGVVLRGLLGADGAHRDLVAIVDKALLPLPGQRYASAGALAEDLRRHRGCLPLAAHAGSWTYRARRFVLRHRQVLGVAASSLALAGLTVFAVSTTLRRDVAWAAYRAHVSAAFAALSVHDVVTARRELDAAPAALRDFEWRHAAARLDRSVGRVRVADRPLSALAVDPTDGSWVVGTDDGALARVRSGMVELVDAPAGAAGIVHDLTFAPGGAGLFGVIQERGFAVWDAATLERVRVFGSAASRPRCMAVDAEARRAVCGYLDGAIELRDVETGAVLATWPGAAHGVQAVALSPDGAVAVVGALDGSVSARDVATGAERWGVRLGPPVVSLAVSADATQVAVGLEDGVAVLSELDSGNEVLRAAVCGDGLMDVVQTPVGWVFAAADRTLRRVAPRAGAWDAAALCGHTGRVRAVAFAGAHCVSVGDDGTLRTWRADTDVVERLRVPEGWFTSLALASDGRRAASWASGDPSHLSVVDLLARTTVWSRPEPASELVGCAFVRGGVGVLALASDGTWSVHDAATGADLDGAGVPLAGSDGARDAVLDFAPAPDGERVAVAWRSGAVSIVDASTGAELVRLDGAHQNATASVCFSPDGTRLLTGGWDGRVALRDAASLALIADLGRTREGIWQVAFGPAGLQVAAASWDPCVLLGPADGSAPLRRLEGHSERVHAVAFSPDGARLASGAADRTVRLWDTARGAEVAVLVGHPARVDDVAFTADGTRLVSQDFRGNVLVWEAPAAAGR